TRVGSTSTASTSAGRPDRPASGAAATTRVGSTSTASASAGCPDRQPSGTAATARGGPASAAAKGARRGKGQGLRAGTKIEKAEAPLASSKVTNAITAAI